MLRNGRAQGDDIRSALIFSSSVARKGGQWLGLGFVPLTRLALDGAFEVSPPVSKDSWGERVALLSWP